MIAPESTLARIRDQAAAGHFRITQHAQQEMVEESITVDELLHAVANASILENSPCTVAGPVACCTVSMATVGIFILSVRRLTRRLS